MYPSSDGSMVFSNIEPQVYQVTADGIPDGIYLKSIRFGEQETRGSRIDLSAASSRLTLAFAAGAGQVSGSIQSAIDTPRSGAFVTIAPAGSMADRADLVRTVTAQFDGAFQIRNLAPGDYRIFAWEDFDSGLARALEFRHLLEGQSTPVTVRAGGSESI